MCSSTENVEYSSRSINLLLEILSVFCRLSMYRICFCHHNRLECGRSRATWRIILSIDMKTGLAWKRMRPFTLHLGEIGRPRWVKTNSLIDNRRCTFMRMRITSMPSQLPRYVLLHVLSKFVTSRNISNLHICIIERWLVRFSL